MREINAIADAIAKSGGTPLAVAKDGKLLGVIHLKDIVKGGIRERFAELRRMGIRTVMITGDNPMTAAAIAAEAGVDDFLAQATPEDKLKLIRDEQAKGKLVAMCGDGTNDAPALAQADVGVAMNTGTQAAREAGNMVDLDSNPTKLIEVVEIGKQLLMTRGALTTFSIANDVAKYFAIIPAMFVAFYPQLQALNIMNLATPQSAILSAIIFNALIIIALIPLALKGVRYRPIGRRPAAAAQPADLRPRRHHHSVHRHQGDRPRGHRLAPRLRRRIMLKEIRPAIVFVVVADDHHRAGLSARHDRHRRVDFPLSGAGQPDRAGRQGGRIGADRAGIHQRQAISTAGRRPPSRPIPTDPTKTVPAPYNAANSGGSNLGPTNKALIERVQGDVDKLKQENPSARGPDRPGDDHRRRPRSRTFRRRRRFSRCRVLRKRATCRKIALRQLVDEHIEGGTLGLLGRAAGERAGAESGAGSRSRCADPMAAPQSGQRI